MTVEKTYTLGPLPWSEETLRKAYFKSFTEARTAIKEHPGFIAHCDLDVLQLSLGIFCDSVTELLHAIDSFHNDANSPAFWRRPARQQFRRRELAVQKGVFAAATSALALVDHSRVVSRKVPIPGYQERVGQLFANSEEHQFIQSLRVNISHVRMIEADWQRVHSGAGEHTHFLLRQETLLTCNEWDDLARAFIDRHPDGIDVEVLFKGYRDRVDNFHKWFHCEVARLSEPALSEYRECERTLNRFGARSLWKIILEQVRAGRIDPYQYLDRYLTKTELQGVLALPMRSREQVDRIIELIDEHGACDEELRQKIYTAFDVGKVVGEIR